MEAVDSHLGGSSGDLHDADSDQRSLKRETGSETAFDQESLGLRSIVAVEDRSVLRGSVGAFTINDVLPIEAARARFLDIVVDHFIVRCITQVSNYGDDCYLQYELDKMGKRKSREVTYEGDPLYYHPLIYVANIYETLVNEVNPGLASLDGFPEKTIGVDLEAVGGVYRRLAENFPVEGPEDKILPILWIHKSGFPEMLVQEKKAVHFVVINGLDIVEKPDTLSVADSEWKISSSKGNSPPKTPLAQPPLGSSFPQTSGESHGTSCSAKSVESKAYVKPANICKSPKNPYELLYANEIPNFTEFCEDAASENCGFQAIAEGVDLGGGSGEDGWHGVRRDLFMSLSSELDLYTVDAPVFTSDSAKKILKALAFWVQPVAPPERRFSIDMGHIVATYYCSVFVVLGQQSVTFLPLYIDWDTTTQIHEHCTAYLHREKCFISLSVTLDEGFSLPPTHPLSADHHHTSVNGLDQCYADRFRKYEWFRSFM